MALRKIDATDLYEKAKGVVGKLYLEANQIFKVGIEEGKYGITNPRFEYSDFGNPFEFGIVPTTKLCGLIKMDCDYPFVRVSGDPTTSRTILVQTRNPKQDKSIDTKAEQLAEIYAKKFPGFEVTLLTGVEKIEWIINHTK